MSHKKQHNKDPFETAGWSMKAYETPDKVLKDIFSNDNPDYFKACISIMIRSSSQIRPLNKKGMEAVFRIFGRVNSLILVAHYYYKKRQRSKDQGSTFMHYKILHHLFSTHSITYWKSEWYYWVQNVYARKQTDDPDTIYSNGYFISTLIDMLYSQYRK